MSDNIEAGSAALALFRLELADPDQDLSIQDVLASLSFPQFSDLPLELRLTIYRCMFPKARRLVFYLQKNPPVEMIYVAPRPPVTSKVNKEAREETLKAYHAVKVARGLSRSASQTILWSSEVDILQCDVHIMIYDFIPRHFAWHEAQWTAFANSVKNIELICLRPEHPRSYAIVSEMVDSDTLRDFSNIQQITLRSPDTNCLAMHVWCDQFVQSFSAFRASKVKENSHVCDPIITIWKH
ncbi:hypothetical protein ONS95_012887 [Cadophora gregata]|uniref:uncharacterized protein n=1 Tax=Cadophora gregata TaxID=51156 RepID=UPI0026DBC478|nr:uncharacterized protein ONS95_012887 [Cadophora gregata]KAK0101132.1 hypothetical protein ONS96_006357 [Cadophora gregata f. sp. sojae]KAK0115836.1 hypothetical protein ONS95_012887 [Cadophora gregata]